MISLRQHGETYTNKFTRQHMLATLYEAQDRCCFLCGKVMEPLRTRQDQRNPMRPTIEHVQPLAFGGQDARGNLVAAHSRCNQRKAHRWPSEDERSRLAALNAKLGWA